MTDRDDDPYWDYDDGDCWNCGGDGYVSGCSWDWQCDTWDDGEGTCLCTRRCDYCNPAKPDPALQQVLADALRDSGSGPQGGDCSQAPGEAPQSGGASRIAHPSSEHPQ